MKGWKWINGVPQLRTLQQLPKYSLTIPQKIGSPAAIPLRDVGDAEETLGVWSCPKGDFGVHIEKKMEKGHLWVERLRHNKCPAADGWLGFRYSLIPIKSPTVLRLSRLTQMCLNRPFSGCTGTFSHHSV